MSGVNSKCSRGDLAPPPSPKRLIPDELLADIFACLAADSDLEALLNVRLVCSLWNREASFALKTNVALLPWIVANDYSMYYVKRALSKTKSESNAALKSLGSCLHDLTPGCGLPLKVVVNKWTPELEYFLRNYSSDIVSFWICGHGDVLDRFPADLGGIELPSLEHAPFSVFGIRNVEGECDGFTKAIAFWKELVKVSKNIKTCPIRISLEPFMDAQNQLSSDHKVFDLVDWSQVDSLSCNVEFFVDVSATHELTALRNLECRLTRILGSPLINQVSFEKALNLEEMTFHNATIEWNLYHPMKNLRVLTLTNNTINCGQSPSELLPNLKKITIVDYGNDGDFMYNGPFACLLMVSGGGVFEKAVELKLREEWFNVKERLSDLAVQLCESFPSLTKLEWSSVKALGSDVDNKNALKAAPAIFSKLEHLTRLVLTVTLASDREVVELITGISLEEIPEEEESWPSALAGNSRSITNLKNLQSFGLCLIANFIRGMKPTVSMRHTRFLFTAAFRTMSTLTDLRFNGITFEDKFCFAEWLQMGRKIEIDHDDDSSSGINSFTMGSDSEWSGDGYE